MKKVETKKLTGPRNAADLLQVVEPELGKSTDGEKNLWWRSFATEMAKWTAVHRFWQAHPSENRAPPRLEPSFKRRDQPNCVATFLMYGQDRLAFTVIR